MPECPSPIYDADDQSYDVKVDSDGFIYVTGFFSGLSADFDDFSIQSDSAIVIYTVSLVLLN